MKTKLLFLALFSMSMVFQTSAQPSGYSRIYSKVGNGGTCAVIVKYHWNGGSSEQTISPGIVDNRIFDLAPGGGGFWITKRPHSGGATISSPTNFFSQGGDLYWNAGICDIPDDESDDGDDTPPEGANEFIFRPEGGPRKGGDANPCDPPSGNGIVGMPSWSVSEPYISLWLQDEPLGYQPSIGPRISFRLAYKQREFISPLTKSFFGTGVKWNCSWFSYVAPSGNGSNVVYFPGGRQRVFSATNDIATDTSLSGDATNGFTVSYRDGSKNVYGWIVTNVSGTFMQAFLTETFDSAARAVRFQYYTNTPGYQPIVRLRYVIDADNRTNTVYYAAGSSYSTNLISHVVDPFGRTNFLKYDNSGFLTNITDVAGLSSSFVYDPNGWITNMTTPYGVTKFAYTDNATTNVAPSGRSILITSPDGSRELYLGTNNAPGILSSYSTADVPVTTPFSNSFDNIELHLRNTFYWGSRQYEALSTTNIGLFTTNDFRKARMKHWLKSGTASVVATLALERSHSPDGTTAGQTVWYDHAGKTTSTDVGTNALPLFTATVLPDGSTRFVRTERNGLDAITREISTYSATNGVALRTNIFTYAANLIDLLTVTNALGVQVSSNAYNSFHQVLTNFNALNEKSVFSYDSSNRLNRVISPTSLVTTNIYGSDGFVSEIRVTGVSTNTFTHSNNLVFTATDARGLTTTNYYDALQRPVKVAFPDGTFITNTWDKLDLVRVVDRMGFTNSFGYDSLRRNTAITNALGHYTLMDYCGCGSLNSVRDAAGNYTYFFYDNAGRQTNTVFADGYSVTNRYNLLGQLTNTIDSAGTSVTNWFNNQGLLVTSSNAFGRINLAIFDALDRATNITDANGVMVTNAFDNASRLLIRGYPDGGIERWGYTANFAGATSYTNQLGSNVVNYAYDLLNRKTNEVFVGISTNKFAYSGANDLLTLTDSKNQMTSWGFDVFGRQSSKTNANGLEIERFIFDPNGRATNRWTAAKGNTIYRHDPVGNITNIDYVVSPDVTLQYDALNQVTNMVDATGTNRFTYNAANQLLTEDGPWASDILTYGYSNRLRASFSLQQPSGTWTNGYLYDVAKRMTNVTSPAGTFGFVFDAARQTLVTRMSLPNSAYITNSYDVMTHLLATQLKNSGGTVLNSHSYTYNLASQRKSHTRTDGSYVDYTYDNISQLKTALGKESGGTTNRLNEQLGYSYDPAGNRKYRTNNALVQTFNNNSLNELITVTRTGMLTVAGNTTTTATNVTVNGLTAIRYTDLTYARTNFPLVDAVTNFTAIAQSPIGLLATNTVTVDLRATNTLVYDLNGNLRTNGNQILEYDDENRLVTNYVAASWKSEFVYDGANRCRIQRDYAWTGSAWNKTNEARLIYDGSSVVQERDTNNTPVVSYTRAGSSLLGRTDNISGKHAFYHMDGNHNVTAMINSSQLIVARYLYDPFGRTLALSGPLAEANLYQFASQRYHANSGLVLYLRRAYSPDLQRFVNRDPIQEAGGQNLFAFVGNNPISGFDPLGLCPDWWDQWFINMYENWDENAMDYLRGFEDGINGTIHSVLHPIDTIGNLGTVAWNIYDDPYGVVSGIGNSLLTSRGIGQAVFGVELGLAGGLFAPETVAASSSQNIVYRGITAADAEALAAGRGLVAKAPNGTWTAAEHVANQTLTSGAVGGAARNSPWISTTRSLEVAKAYDSGHGVIAIDLNKVSSFQAEVWKHAPRVNGVNGLPFHRSFWAQEVTLFQEIPASAILGTIKK